MTTKTQDGSFRVIQTFFLFVKGAFFDFLTVFRHVLIGGEDRVDMMLFRHVLDTENRAPVSRTISVTNGASLNVFKPFEQFLTGGGIGPI